MKVAIVLGSQSYGDILILIGFTVKLIKAAYCTECCFWKNKT